MHDSENKKGNSHRQILRSSAIIGGASVINILVGLLKMKLVAVLLGPVGVGLIGILQNLMNTAAQLSALGFEQVGTRQIAEARGRKDQVAVDAARRALFWGTLGLAALGAFAVWIGNDLLAEYVLDDTKYSETIGWIAIGVALTVATSSQRALLTGMRRIGDIAKLTIISSLAGTAIGASAIFWLEEAGIAILVIATPAAGFIISYFYIIRLPKIQSGTTPIKDLVGQWKTLARLGSAFMVAGVIMMLGQLVVRSMVQQQLGTDELGYFQASWMISMTYIGFVLSAMGTDYYPRLSATIHDKDQAIRLVNEQTEVVILLAGPVMLGMLAFAPWVMQMLYTAEFGPAITILRWQILGDVLKIISWPLGFMVLASGKGIIFMFKEAIIVAVFILITWLLLPYVQVEATGIAFLSMYVIYLPLVFFIVRYLFGFSWKLSVARDAMILMTLATVIAVLGAYSDLLGAVVGGLITISVGLVALYRLAEMSELDGPVGRVLSTLRTRIAQARN